MKTKNNFSQGGRCSHKFEGYQAIFLGSQIFRGALESSHPISILCPLIYLAHKKSKGTHLGELSKNYHSFIHEEIYNSFFSYELD